jgi:threonine synthase
MVKAYLAGETHATRWQNASTVAMGIRVPQAIGDFLILQAVRDSGGFAIAVDDDDIIDARDTVAHKDGLLMCPEGAATYAAYRKSLREGKIAPADRVVLFNCASGLKYELPPVGRKLDLRGPIDFKAL